MNEASASKGEKLAREIRGKVGEDEYVNEYPIFECNNCGNQFRKDNIFESKASPEYLHQQRRRLLAKAEEDRVCPVCGEKSPYVRMGDFWETHFADKHRLNESKATEYNPDEDDILAGRSIEEYLKENDMTIEEGEKVARYADMDLRELIQVGNFGEAKYHMEQDNPANWGESKKVNKLRGGA